MHSADSKGPTTTEHWSFHTAIYPHSCIQRAQLAGALLPLWCRLPLPLLSHSISACFDPVLLCCPLLLMLLQACGREDECIETYKWLEDNHPIPKVCVCV